VVVLLLPLSLVMNKSEFNNIGSSGIGSRSGSGGGGQ
jgi:hypothetical protein